MHMKEPKFSASLDTYSYVNPTNPQSTQRPQSRGCLYAYFKILNGPQNTLVTLPHDSQRATSCANHTEASGPEKDIIKRRSFLTVSSPDTVYSFTGPKLRCDHLNLCIPINKLRSAASGVKEEDNVSSSQESLLLVTESITCRLHCFSSCFGSEERGRIELVARLEDLTGPEPIILGMDRVEVRCSATPSRDINRLRDRLLSKSCGSSEGPPATAKASPMSGPGRKNLMLTSTDSSANSQTPSLRNYRGLQAFRDSFVNTTTKCDRPTVIVDPTLQTQFREDMLRYERKLVRAWQRYFVCLQGVQIASPSSPSPLPDTLSTSKAELCRGVHKLSVPLSEIAIVIAMRPFNSTPTPPPPNASAGHRLTENEGGRI
ncbi:unnamed protein product [Schistocephalus solidus]|uniref:P53 domain-containing protein n=1 Tax=Schistocephalus solidus TaxID=70667 RepID=A0A183SK07_SCHSO|nr:unnamed protein product [Schistocephalus solidus]